MISESTDEFIMITNVHSSVMSVHGKDISRMSLLLHYSEIKKITCSMNYIDISYLDNKDECVMFGDKKEAQEAFKEIWKKINKIYNATT